MDGRMAEGTGSSAGVIDATNRTSQMAVKLPAGLEDRLVIKKIRCRVPQSSGVGDEQLHTTVC